jgi:chitin-binding protein
MVILPVKRLAMYVALAQLGLFSVNGASANGYVASPAARAHLCKTGENINCDIQTKYQSDQIISETTVSGFPDLNGIANGGLLKYQDLNKESEERWKKNNITPGSLNISWQITSPSHFSGWRYYITQPNWQKTLTGKHQLSTASFESQPFCQISSDVSKTQQGMVTHHCNLPNHNGYQLIYAVADQPNGQSIYNIIDVNIDKSNTTITTTESIGWEKEIATIDKPQKLKVGDIVRVRFFSDNEEPHREIKIKIKSGEENNWAETVAMAINAQHSDIRAGVIEENGEVKPAPLKVNSIYVNNNSYLTGAVISIN